MSKIKVLIVDDSATVRTVIANILSRDNDIEILGAAANPVFAQRKMEKVWPDVIILDLEMPKMDGLTFLKHIMSTRPTPVIICSAHVESGAGDAIKALSLGAVEVISKPALGIQAFLTENARGFIHSVKAAACASTTKLTASVAAAGEQEALKKQDAEVILPLSKPQEKKLVCSGTKIVAIGSSTGGTIAIESVLARLSDNIPPLLIVQHMPGKFTRAFANRLNNICRLTIKEAEDGDRLNAGCVYISPGDRHMLLKYKDNRYYIQLKDGPLVSRHKPSVDVLFRSVASCAGKNALGIILTGMGNDGAQGMLEMRKAGALTLAQDEASSIIFGMPKAALKNGGAMRAVSLADIPGTICQFK
ncbi:protein-glutamate methylesterase/protein-glutamine glutaminase [Thalassomonas actiniarum]|uniref:Protein-glutamate methylesterase/protein-glutamine glutaminase n=1 Tax=Thalassomonas actiniarum TaxID=485447 RepID=A0AAF0C4J5_9GAMM|nr:chemotaxis response regulator protein-glutamate methylesterase [Thalassomonas actiniarum]WDE00091.1 chemotaxis response regulator protein-glutamate methylesterase [Thalassomonas actiniarum]